MQLTADTPATQSWRVRLYGERMGDYDRVSAWLTSRGLPPLVESVLPPDGIIVECNGDAVAACWLYLTHGIGVAFWEGMITKPGLGPSMVRQSIKHAAGIIKAIAKENDCGLIKGYVRARLLPLAKTAGWVPIDRDEIKDGFVQVILVV